MPVEAPVLDATPGRTSLTESFSQSPGQGLGQMTEMFMPRAGAAGQFSFKDLVRDFVEFSPVGDVKDFASGLAGRDDQGNKLDWLERALGILGGKTGTGLTLGGIGTVGMRHVVQKAGAANVNPTNLPHAQAELAGADRSLGLTDVRSLVDHPAGVQPAQARAGFLSQMREESWGKQDVTLHGLKSAERVEDLAVLALSSADPDFADRVHSEDTISGADEGLLENATAFLRAWSTTLTDTVPDLRVDSPDTDVEVEFQNLQVGLGYLHSLAKGGTLFHKSKMLTPSETLARLLSDPDSHVELAETVGLSMRLGMNLDGSVTPTSSVAAMWRDEASGEMTAAVAWKGELLPSQRFFDGDDVSLPMNEERLLNGRFRQVDWRAAEPEMAWNLLWQYARQTLSLTPEDLQLSKDWYKRLNSSILKLSEVTGVNNTEVAAILADFSSQTAWLPNNLVGAIHFLLPRAFKQGSAEYKSAFKEVVTAGQWEGELAKESTGKMAHVQGQVDAALEAWADIDNWTYDKGLGSILGTFDSKMRRANDILKHQLPLQLVLGQYKTHNFAALGLDPALLAAVIDTHSFNAAIGTTRGSPGGTREFLFDDDGNPVYRQAPEGTKVVAKGDGFYYQAGKKRVKVDSEGFHLDDDGKRVKAYRSHSGVTMGFTGTIWQKVMGKNGKPYVFPDSGLVIDENLVNKTVAVLQEKNGRTEAQAKAQVQDILQRVQKPEAAAIFQSFVRAHQIAADVVGELPHVMQAVSWADMKGVKDEIATAKTQAAGATLDPYFLHLAEGVTQKSAGALAHVEAATVDFTAIPPFVLKKLSTSPKNVFQGTDSVVAVPTADGSVSILALLDGAHADPTRDTLRTLSPTVIQVGEHVLMQPSAPLAVRDIGETFKLLADGGAAAETRVFQPGSKRPELAPGVHVTVEVKPGEEAEVARLIAGSGIGQYPQNSNVVVQRTATHPRLPKDAWERMASGLEDPANSPVVTADWGALSAERWNLTPAENAARHLRLGRELRAQGYTVVESEGRWPDDDGNLVGEKSYLVFGVPNSKLIELGRKYDRDAVASRHAMFYLKDTDEQTADTHVPATGEFSFGDQARDLPFFTALEHGGESYAFSGDYDWESPVGTEDPDSLMGAALPEEKRVRMTIPQGTARAPSNWPDTQRLIDLLVDRGVLSMEVHSHGALWVPDGYVRVSEHQYSSDVTFGAFRTAGDVDTRVTNQYDVWVPPHQAALTMSDATERYSRTPAQLKEMTTVVDENTVDVGGVTFAFLPDDDIGSDVPSGRQLSRTVNGKKAKTAVITTTDRGPIVHVGVDLPAGPGVVRVEVNGRNGIGRVDAVSPSDLLAAHETLASTGVRFEGSDAFINGEPLQLSWSN